MRYFASLFSSVSAPIALSSAPSLLFVLLLPQVNLLPLLRSSPGKTRRPEVFAAEASQLSLRSRILWNVIRNFHCKSFSLVSAAFSREFARKRASRRIDFNEQTTGTSARVTSLAAIRRTPISRDFTIDPVSPVSTRELVFRERPAKSRSSFHSGEGSARGILELFPLVTLVSRNASETVLERFPCAAARNRQTSIRFSALPPFEFHDCSGVQLHFNELVPSLQLCARFSPFLFFIDDRVRYFRKTRVAKLSDASRAR